MIVCEHYMNFGRSHRFAMRPPPELCALPAHSRQGPSPAFVRYMGYVHGALAPQTYPLLRCGLYDNVGADIIRPPHTRKPEVPPTSGGLFNSLPNRREIPTRKPEPVVWVPAALDAVISLKSYP